MGPAARVRRAALRSIRRRPRVELVRLAHPFERLPELPDRVEEHPGMISSSERRLLVACGTLARESDGRIWDLGAFLGASGLALAHGWSDPALSPSWGGPGRFRPVISVDRFIVEQPLDRFVGAELAARHPVGSSSTSLVEELLGAELGLIEMRVADAVEVFPAPDEAPSVLFVDVMKTIEVADHVFAAFFPRLVVGSVVVHQDYFHHGLPFIKVVMESLAHRFEYLGECNSSAVFRCVAPVLPSDVSSFAAFDDDVAVRLHRCAERRTRSVYRRMLCRLSRARLLGLQGRRADAEAQLRRLRRRYWRYLRDYAGVPWPALQQRIDETVQALAAPPGGATR